MRTLQGPRQLLRGAGKVYLFAHQDFRAWVDKRTWNALQRISLSIKSVTQPDYVVNVRKLAPQFSARNWMAAHPDTFDYWMQPDSEE